MLNIDSWIRFALTEAYAVALLAFVFRKPMTEERKNVWLKILLIMLAMYLAHLFYAYLSPTYFFRRFAFSTERVNLVPFRALKEWLANPINFFGSVLFFMPIGFFEVLLHPNHSRKWQLLFSAATAFILSLFLEFAQCFNYRVPDVDDIILNTIGASLGSLLCMLQQRLGFDRTRVGRVLLPRIPRSWRRHALLNRFCVLLVVTMEIFIVAANYILTIPKPQIRENTAAQVAMALPAATAEPETPAVTTPESELAAAAVTAVPSPTPRVYDTANLALEARNVLLVRLADDAESEQTIYAVDSEKSIYPASTLKMLTALTVLDVARSDEMVEVGMEIYIPPLDASRASLEYGMKLSVRDLLKGLLLPSGADAAYTLGVYCGRKLAGSDEMSIQDAVKTFIAAMNQKAADIGAARTTAVNVVGLDDKKQQTTAQDILTIAKAFLENPVLSEICSLPTAKITSENGKTISLKNTNKMLLAGSGYYNEDVEGVKTGTTSKAGNCLVSVFTIEGERYLCIVMNSSYYGKFTDTQKLYELCANAQ